MTPISTLPPLPVAIPLLGAALLASLRKWLSRAAADSLGIAVALGTFVVSSMVLAAAAHGTTVYWFGNWYPRGSMVLGIPFVVDPIGAGLAWLAALLTLLALIFSWRFVDAGGNHFQSLMLVFLAAMSGFCLTGDLFNMFVFFELMSTAAFALCGLKTAETAPLQGAFNFAITNSIAAFLVLTGIGLLYAVTGALNMAQIGSSLGARHDPLVLFACTLLTCGFFIKAAVVPFHLWLPDAHAVAPTPVCVMFSGLMVELGLYAIVRLHSVIFAQTLNVHPSRLRAILFAFGTITVLVGGLMCYAEHHLKRLLAYSTVCHAGLMLVAFSIHGPLAVAAMLTYLLTHALVKSGLFFVAGIILHRLRSISERILFARGGALRWTALLWFLGAAGLAAAPPFGTMLGEAAAAHAAELAGVRGVSLIFLFAGATTAAAVLRVGARTFLGWGDAPLSDPPAEVGELPETKTEQDKKICWFHFTPAALCIVAAALLAFLPRWASFIGSGAAGLSNQAAYIHTVYSGGQSTGTMQLPGRDALPGAALRGLLGCVLAVLLAGSSVFGSRLPRRLRLGPLLEIGIRPLRAMQSGHPGDYVLWITIGLAVFGSAALFLLRS